MALTIADLLAKLSLDTSGFRKGAEEAATASEKIAGSANKASEATGKTEESNKRAGKSFGDLAQSLNDTTQKFQDLLTPANLFGTVIGVTVVGALKSAIDHAFEFTSELRRLSLVTGDSLGRVAEFQGAVDKLGVGSDKLSRAFFFLSSEMENGGANLAKLGIELHTAEGYEKSVIDITQEMSDKFRAMGAGADVAAAARKILGRQAIDMLPVFQLEREQIRQLGEEEKRFSEQIGTDGLTAMTRFRGSLMEIGGAVTRVQTLLVLDLAPGFKLVADFTSAAVDSLLKVPAPIRHIGEAIAALTVSLIAATLATKAFAAALELAGLASWATGLGSAINAIRLLVAGLVLFITLGPMVKDALVAILPQSVIAAWQSFTGMIGSAYQAMKNFIGLGPKEIYGPPSELATKKYEPTLADEQKRLQYTQQLTAAQIALGQATMTSEAAQVNAIKLTLKQRLDELAVQARFDTTPTNLARTAALRTAAEKTAGAQIAQITQQANLQLLTIEEQTAEQRLAIEGKSRDAALAVRIDEIEQAKKLVADEYAAFGVSQEGYINETIRLNGLELAAKQDAITKEMTQVRAAQQLKAILIGQQVSAHIMTQAKADEELVKLQVDTDAKLRDLTTKTETTKREITNQNRELEKKAIQDELIFVAQAENRELALKLANLETYKRNHTESVQVVIAATAEEYRLLKSAYDKDVQNYIDAELLKTGIFKDETTKRLAQEAGLLRQLETWRQQSLDNMALVLEYQARLADDLGKAYEVGFAHAASSADDAFRAMVKAGADAYQSLKSGLSDFLFDVFTGAQNIGDVFVNLGKRILRTFTDVFAEIIAKQAMMAAGFSLPGLLGMAGSAAAGTFGLSDSETLAAAKAELASLGDTAAGATDALTGVAHGGSLVTVAFSAITQTIGMFASGIVAVLQFIGSLASGNAAGGVASLFGSGGGSLLGQLTSGLSSIFSALSGGFDRVLTGVFDLLTSGGQNVLGFGGSGAAAVLGQGMSFIADAAPWIGAAYGLFQMFSGRLSPMSGAIQGAMIGTMFMPGVGTVVGAAVGALAGLISGLFSGPPPHISGRATLAPTTADALLAAKPVTLADIVQPRDFHSVATSGPLDIDVYKRHAAHHPSRDEWAVAMANIVIETVQAAFKAFQGLATRLPEALSHKLTDRIDVILAEGFELVHKSYKGDKALKKFQEFLTGLSGDLLQTLSDKMFGPLDLKELGGGDVVKGFDGLIAAMSAMGAISKAVAKNLDFSSVTLEQFAQASVDFFQKFTKEGEAFTDTVKRVSQDIGGILTLIDSLGTQIASATANLDQAIKLQQDHIATAQANVTALVDALVVATESGSSPADVLSAAQSAAQAVQDSLQMQISLVSRLHDHIQALQQEMVKGIDLLADLTTSVMKLRTATGSTVGDVTVSSPSGFNRLKRTVTQTTLSPIDQAFNELRQAFNASGDLSTRVSIWSSALGMLLTDMDAFNAHLGAMRNGFAEIQQQLMAAPPEQAIAAAKDLMAGIEAGLQAGIATIQADFAAQRQAVQDATAARITALEAEKTAITNASNARIQALEDEKTAIQNANTAQMDALNAQTEAARQWESMVQSVKSQLTDIFNLLAPTHPLTSFNQVRSQLESTFAQFQAGPTPELAAQVQELAKQTLQLAQGVPGMDLPSQAFQSLASEITGMLQTVESTAGAQQSVESLTAQIKDLQTEQTAHLADIDAQIQAERDRQSQQLAGIDAQIQAARDSEAAQLASLQAAEQAAIQDLQAKALSALEGVRQIVMVKIADLQKQQADEQARLQAILGNKTYEEYIATKQQEAVTLLQGIQDTLKSYLGTLIQGVLPNATIPAMAVGGIVTRPTLALIGESGPEAVMPLSRMNSGSGETSITFNVSVTASGDVNAKKLADQLETELIERMQYGRLRRAVQDAQR